MILITFMFIDRKISYFLQDPGISSNSLITDPKLKSSEARLLINNN